MKLVVLIYNLIAYGIALKFLFNWFIAEPFSINEINIPAALGISLLLKLMLSSPKEEFDDTIFARENPQAYYLLHFLVPPFALFLGFIIHLFQ